MAPTIPPNTFTCLCTHVSLSISYSTTQTFPLPIELCHCNTCRHTSGALAGAFVELHSPPPGDVLARCVEYRSSEKVARWFCGTCGGKCFIRGWGNGPEGERVIWFAWAGIVERGGDDGQGPGGNERVETVKVESQAFLADTKDGGLVGRMVEILRKKTPKETGGKEGSGSSSSSEKIDLDTNGKITSGPLKAVFADTWDGPTLSLQEIDELVEKGSSSSSTTTTTTDSARLLAKCHCASVQFHITRPDPTTPYDEKTQYYIKAHNTRYLGRLCLCRSCRAATGNPLHPWIYVPPEHVVTTQGEAITFGAGAGADGGALKELGGGIRRYRSEVDGDVVRSFCGTCGATVFYESGRRGWVVDVSVGILRAEGGALAKEWVEWSWEESSCVEECEAVELLECVTGRGVAG